ALAAAALKHSHPTTLILGPVAIDFPSDARRIDVQTADEMLRATLAEFPSHDLLILAAAVADYRPKLARSDKISRHGALILECEATEDIAAAAGRAKLPHQRTIGFSLEADANIERAIGRAKEKLLAKNLDLIVFNPPATIASDKIEPVLIFPDGRNEPLPSASKSQFADILLDRAIRLWKRDP
ncbi:MAG: phosphopantothenoylcysteine decarboxylase, partial [Tepidisphaeraceae bacterium]